MRRPPVHRSIYEAENWVENELGSVKKDSLWHVQIAITCRSFRHLDLAVERCMISSILDPSDWRPRYCLAETYGLQKRYTLALEALEDVINMFMDCGEDLVTKSGGIYYNPHKGQWNMKLQEYEAAMVSYWEVYGFDRDDYTPIFMILKLLDMQGQHSELITTSIKCKTKEE